ncbi:hypothetical protein [Micromonospora zhanjiangensis]|uniref:Uncharacterized protein n=1 Tax=Micromonospora zhanjiangensis TaxID=1522057 RepID=A0ABV8KVM2_9ACTN
MKDYHSDWTEEQSAVYDEAYRVGQEWAQDPETPVDEQQRVVNLAEADEDDLADVEIEYQPLVDAVADATGVDLASVPASRDDPGFAGFVDGVRDAVAGDTFGL